jgi:hypothetical protein
MIIFLHSNGKRQVMVALFIISLFTSFFVFGEEDTSIYQKKDFNASILSTDGAQKIFSYLGRSGSNAEGYFQNLQPVLRAFEEDHLTRIEPGAYPKIAIKLETAYAPGMHTSVFLVEALLEWLKRRGFRKQNVVLFDRNLDGLKSAGFLPESERSNEFKGHRVLHALDSDYYLRGWFHDSPLPPTSFDRAKFILEFPTDPAARLLEERKSYLPAPIFKDAYWINLAIPMDDVFLGIDGAASNMTLGAISNHGRFRQKKTMAPATVAEVMAIPEIWDKRIFSILDFTTFQIANGQRFDSQYTEKESSFLLSRDPFSIDYLALKVINKQRKARGFSVRSEADSLLLRYAEELGLGLPRKTILKKMRY